MPKVTVGGKEIQVGRITAGPLANLLENGHVETLRKTDGADDKANAARLRAAVACIAAAAKVTEEWMAATIFPEEIAPAMDVVSKLIGPSGGGSPNAASP